MSWVDATAFIDACCPRLHDEELVHGEGFSLYDAMLGVLIGNDKMDIGMRREGGPSAEQLVADGAAPLGLAPARLEALARQLLQAEASWHLGGMLPTTVFTSLYMLDIPRCPFRVVFWGRGAVRQGLGSGVAVWAMLPAAEACRSGVRLCLMLLRNRAGWSGCRAVPCRPVCMIPDFSTFPFGHPRSTPALTLAGWSPSHRCMRCACPCSCAAPPCTTLC